MLKKLMSVVVITAMLLGMLTSLPGNAQSSDGGEAERFLSVLGIVSSDNIDTSGEISREEFSLMLARTIKLDESVKDEVRYFRDVELDSYAVNAINALAANNIISVPENKEFRPEDSITFEEACKMIVCAAGYELVADGSGGYPAGYVFIAGKMGVKAGTVGKAISYEEAYDILYNTMLAKLPHVDHINGSGDVLYNADGDISILTEYWDIYRAEGTVEALYGMSIDTDVINNKNEVKVGGKLYKFKDVNNLVDLFGGYAEVFYQKTKNDDVGSLVFARKKCLKNDVRIESGNVLDADLTKIIYYNERDREVTLNLTFAKVIYNGRFLESNIKEKIMNINEGHITIKDSDNDGKYDVVLINDYRNFVVSNVSEEKIYNMLKTGDFITPGKYESERVFTGNVESDFDSVTAGNVLSVAQSVDGLTIEVIISSDEFDGAVTQINNKNGIWYLTINETMYPVEKSYGISLFGSNGQKQSPLLFGKRFNVKLNSFGNIAYMERISDDMKTGVIIKGGVESGIDERVSILLLTQEGIFETFSFADKVRVNGITQNDGKKMLAEILNTSDKLIRYTKDKNGNINAVVTAEFNGSAEFTGEKIRSIYNGTNQQWYNSGRLGTSALTTKETPVFMIPYGDNNPDEEDCAVLNYSSLTDNIVYYCNAYHFDSKSVAADAAVVYYEYSNLYDNIDMYRPVIMFSRTEERLSDDGTIERIVIGYTRGGRVEYIVPDSISFAGIDEGDMIMLNHGINGNVVEGSKGSGSDIEVVCKVKDIYTDKKPLWTKNAYHDYLYSNSETVVNDYYRTDFQMSFGYVCKVLETQVAWSYNNGDNFSEAANITGNIVIFDDERRDGEKIFVGKAADLITYDAAGYDCSKIIFRTRSGRLWETFCYN